MIVGGTNYYIQVRKSQSSNDECDSLSASRCKDFMVQILIIVHVQDCCHVVEGNFWTS